MPDLVKMMNHVTVLLLSTCSDMALAALKPNNFWACVCSLGGEWMWDGFVNKGKDLTWLVDGLGNGKIIGLTDGLYNCKGESQVSGSGWLLC